MRNDVTCFFVSELNVGRYRYNSKILLQVAEVE